MITKQFMQVSTVITLMATSVAGFAQTKVIVIPLDVPIVPTSKTIFVTSQAFNGNLGGISGADDKCQAEANGAMPPVPGIFKAWLGTSFSGSISNRTSFIKHDLPYNNINGDNVANNFNDFLDGDFNAVIRRVDDPNNNNFSDVWTGTRENGSVIVLAPTDQDCQDWRSSSEQGTGRIGFSEGGVQRQSWTDEQDDACAARNRLYCFEQ